MFTVAVSVKNSRKAYSSLIEEDESLELAKAANYENQKTELAIAIECITFIFKDFKDC
jgi:hypothetical protein